MRRRIGIDLKLTLTPSFTLALFEEIEYNTWVKVVGYEKGSTIRFKNGVVEYDCSDKTVEYWTGEWFKPERYLDEVVEDQRTVVENILRIYSRVSLSVDPFDKNLLIVPIALSRRTDYARNVLRWCLAIWKRTETLEGILRTDLSTIGNSYQLKQLKTVVKDFLDKVVPHLDEDPSEIRRTLLTCRWIGPKTADAYLLFTGIDISTAPVDVHLKRMNFRIFRIPYKYEPTKPLCSRYECAECPHSEGCLRYLFTKDFKRLAGWLQTISYLHDRLYCSRSLCRECPLKSVCRESGRTVRSSTTSRED